MSEDIFVGRETEFKQFEELLDETRAGNGKMVFMHGESGSGKTTLIRRFVEDHDEGCLIAIAECIDKDGATPYAPFKNVLVQLNSDAVGTDAEKRKTTRERLMAVVNESGPEWIAAIPVIGEITTAGIRTVQATKKHFGNKMTTENIKNAEDVQNVYENELRRLSKQEPLIIFLDDLQWADQSSLNLLFVLGRSLRSNPFPLLIIGSYRPHDITMGRELITQEGTYTTVRHPLTETLNELRNYTKKESHVARADEWLVELSISPFNPEDIDKLIDQLYPTHKFPEDFCDQMRIITEGHPLFATEILGFLQQKEEIYQDDQGVYLLKSEELTGLPTSIGGVIGERVSHINDELRKVLECSSVNGEEFISNIIMEVLRVDELDLFDQLEELSRKHDLIRADDSELVGDELLEKYRFTHRLVHNYVYQNIDAPKRRILHKRIAKALRTIYGADSTSLIQDKIDRHMQIARGLIDGITLRLTEALPEEELDVSAIIEAANSEIHAAEESFQQYAMAECLQHCDKALAFLSQIPELTPEAYEAKFLAQKNRNLAQDWLGHYEEALETAQDMLTSAEKTSNKEHVFHALQSMGEESGKLGKYRQAIGFHEQGLILYLDDEESPLVGQAYRDSGAQYAKLGEYERAIELFKKALEIHELNNDQQNLAGVHNNIGLVLQQKNDFDGAIENYQKSLEITKQIGNDEYMSTLYNNIGGVMRTRGDYDGAIEQLKQALEINEKLERKASMHVDMNNIGMAMMDKGDVDGAMEWFKKALAIVEEINDRVNMAIVYTNIGTAHSHKAEFDQSIEFNKKALAIAEEMDDRVKMATRFNNIGLALGNKGDFEGAINYYKKALAIDLGLGNKVSMALDYNNIGMAMQRKGDIDGAINYTSKALRIAQKSGDRLNMAFRYNNIATLYFHKGDLDESINAFQKALAIFSDIGDQSKVSQVSNNIGKLHMKKENYDEAISFFKRAIAIATEKNDQVHMAHFCYNLGQSYLKQEDYPNALKFVEKAVDSWYYVGKVPPNIGKTFDELDAMVEELEDKIGF